MNKRKELIEILENCLRYGRENEYFDVKGKWHSNIKDLIKDIICLSNTSHDEKTYIIIGEDDKFNIVGINPDESRKMADITDAFSKLSFATPTRPQFHLERLDYKGKIIDILVIENIKETPIYLNRHYGDMRPGCIYSRKNDRNTANNGNSSIDEIELLWKKRFGLLKDKKQILLERLINKRDWCKVESEYYIKFEPEYRMKMINQNSDNNYYDEQNDAFYSYAMMNTSTYFYTLEIYYNASKLGEYEFVSLDSGNLMVPTPIWDNNLSDLGNGYPNCMYKYYMRDTEEGRLLSFFYDSQNSDQRFAFNDLQEVVLIYNDEEEKKNFEKYVKKNKELFKQTYDNNDKYNIISSMEKQKNYTKLETYKSQLKYCNTLRIIFDKWKLGNKLDEIF